LDGGVTENTKFYKKLVGGHLHLPPPRKPQNGTTDLPYDSVGDEDFTLSKDFLNPFSQKVLKPERKIFNYHISRSRKMVAKFFGMISRHNFPHSN
jgi:hypothetical protein